VEKKTMKERTTHVAWKRKRAEDPARAEELNDVPFRIPE
jgi:hypothetical protein